MSGTALSGAGVGSKATQPYPSNGTSTQAEMSRPRNSTSASVDDGASAEVAADAADPADPADPADEGRVASAGGTKPTATRAGTPIARTINAIRAAYCSWSPTIGLVVSMAAIRSSP